MSFSVCLTSLSMTISRTGDSTQQSLMVNMGKRILKKERERERERERGNMYMYN